MSTPEVQRQLRKLLATLYPDGDSIKRIAHDAGIRTALTRLTDRSTNDWHAILQEAEKQDRLAQLLAVVEEEYGENWHWQMLKLQLDGRPAPIAELTVIGHRVGAWLRWRNGLLIGLLLLIGVGVGLTAPQARTLLLPFIATPTPATPTATPQPTPAAFTYNVTVRDTETNQTIADAQVQIAVEGKATLTEYADSYGLGRLFVPKALAGRPGQLTVAADGYRVDIRNIDLWPDQLPAEVRLARE